MGNALWGQIQGIQREQPIKDPLFIFLLSPGRTSRSPSRRRPKDSIALL
jgi:hypothetical protein